ncbi:MAG: hypothetical protein Q8P18_20740 [Pseudomonadota bacterium]|nr:hypothetical protein [Pseudomonadota bacterium]
MTRLVRYSAAFATFVALLLPLPALARATKVDVCHAPGASRQVINVSSSAVGAHVAHGDHVVTDEVCGDGVDNNCDGEIDEDCCPCFTQAELVSWFDAGDQCIDFDLGTPDAAFDATYLASYEGAGLAAGVGDYPFYPANFCAVIDLTNTGAIQWGITDEEYVDCAMIVLDAAAELEIACTNAPVAE